MRMEHVAELGGVVTGFNVTAIVLTVCAEKISLKSPNSPGRLSFKKQFLRKKDYQESWLRMKNIFLYTISVRFMY